ncbi:MAG: 4-hydroxy-tetrahydrodipicolinate reductase [Gammaproteobacteria bacterium]|nr:4-hydroxy-tetrahydrodipicolinate reductase [Gammaproteobacteria bacterium]
MAGSGRMGQAIVRAIAAHKDFLLAGLWVRDPERAASLNLPRDVLISSDIDAVAAVADVVIDFSLPAAISDVLAAVTRHGKPVVCGVSGLTDAQRSEMDAAARTVAVVYDRNMSLGVAVLEIIVRQASAALGDEFAAEVHETHHIHKLDSPSGTALKLGEAIAAARGTAAEDIHYEVERRGDVPGDHSVVLSSATERLTLAHSVTTRDVFADGALRAARWIVSRQPGRYSMHDVLNLGS